MVTPPAAPLEKAVAAARGALADYDGCKGYEADEYAMCCIEPFRSLLAALDADKRLEEAEEALREIAAKAGVADECGRFDVVGDFHECDDQKPSEDWCSVCIARRYFARREDEKDADKRPKVEEEDDTVCYHCGASHWCSECQR